MDDHLKANQNSYTITVRQGTIVEVTDLFCDFIGYEKKELLGNSIEDVFEQLLLDNGSFRLVDQSASLLIFTKALKPRRILLENLLSLSEKEIKYRIIVEDDFALIEEDQFLQRVMGDEVTGVGIYTVNDYRLLVANKRFLSYLYEEHRLERSAYGKRLVELDPTFNGSVDELLWKEVILTQKSLSIKEHSPMLFNDNSRFWDNTVVPLIKNGEVKYLAAMLEDVTERVQSRTHIKRKRDQLEAILDNLSEGVVAFDQWGETILANRKNKQLTAEVVWLGEQDSEFQHVLEECDSFIERPISMDDLPKVRVLRGEKIEKQLMLMKKEGKYHFYEYNGGPLYNEIGEFKLGILVSRDVTELLERELKIKQQQKQLLEAEWEKHRALEQSIQAKDEFFHLITHELKTPLAVINSALQTMDLVVCEKETSPKVKRFIRTIRQNTNRQLRLVNNLLDAMKTNLSNVQLQCNDFDFVELVESVVRHTQEIAVKKRINLLFVSNLERKSVCADEKKMQRILLNLLSNALKFSQSGKKIHVFVFQQSFAGETMVGISIRDEGIGIPPDKQEHIFERFGQVNTSFSRQAEGVGIGLYLVKLFVEAMGGHIFLQSKEGEGSTFTLLFPVGVDELEEMPDEKNYSVNDELRERRESRLTKEAAIELSDIYFYE